MNSKNEKTILLVEDEVIIAIDQAQRITSFGYEVVTANSGEEAIKLAIENNSISLILMDMDLGRGITGPEAAQRILVHRHVPIVFLTSHSEREMVENVRGITRYGYVIKNSGEFVLQTSIEMAYELFESNRNLQVQSVSSEELTTKEKSLTGEKEFTEALLESIPGFLYVYDDTRHLVRWNKKHETMTGYSSEELSRMTLSQWFEGEDVIRVAEAMSAALATGYGEVEAHLLTKDGRKLLVHLNGVRLEINGKRYFTGVGVDITDPPCVSVVVA